jgi:hypothetical protein
MKNYLNPLVPSAYDRFVMDNYWEQEPMQPDYRFYRWGIYPLLKK